MKSLKQKIKKKKERAAKVKIKLQKQHEQLVKERKLHEEDILKERTAFELEHGKPIPFVKDENKRKAMETRKEESVSDRLKKNLEILEALEAEYDREQENRQQANEKLESEGFFSIKEKMNALHQKALELQGLSEKLAEAQKDAVKLAEHQE